VICPGSLSESQQGQDQVLPWGQALSRTPPWHEPLQGVANGLTLCLRECTVDHVLPLKRRSSKFQISLQGRQGNNRVARLGRQEDGRQGGVDLTSHAFLSGAASGDYGTDTCSGFVWGL
jgi:hypothetical protein